MHQSPAWQTLERFIQPSFQARLAPGNGRQHGRGGRFVEGLENTPASIPGRYFVTLVDGWLHGREVRLQRLDGSLSSSRCYGPPVQPMTGLSSKGGARSVP